MVGSKTSFTGGKELFFNLTTQGKLYESYGVESDRRFMKMLNEKEKSTGITTQDYITIILFGMMYKDKTVTRDVTEELINQYLDEGHGQDDLYLLVYETFTNSGMFPKTSFKKLKDLREMSEEQLEEYLEKIMDKKLEGEDTGEALKI